MGKPVKRVYPCPAGCRNGWVAKKGKNGVNIQVACTACGGKGHIVK